MKKTIKKQLKKYLKGVLDINKCNLSTKEDFIKSEQNPSECIKYMNSIIYNTTDKDREFIRLDEIRDESYTYEVVDHIIRYFPAYFFSIPTEYHTDENIDSLLEDDPFNIKFIPIVYLTNKRCKYAVSENGNVLKFIPTPFKTYHIQKLAVENELSAMWYVEKPVPHDLIILALTKYAKIFPDIFDYMYDSCLTEEICLHALHINPHIFTSFHNKFQTHRIVDKIIESGIPELIQRCNPKFITHEMIINSIDDGVSPTCFPTKCITKEIVIYSMISAQWFYDKLPLEYAEDLDVIEASILKGNYLSNVVYRFSDRKNRRRILFESINRYGSKSCLLNKIRVSDNNDGELEKLLNNIEIVDGEIDMVIVAKQRIDVKVEYQEFVDIINNDPSTILNEDIEFPSFDLYLMAFKLDEELLYIFRNKFLDTLNDIV